MHTDPSVKTLFTASRLLCNKDVQDEDEESYRTPDPQISRLPTEQSFLEGGMAAERA
jgi:hypothetical protein